MNLSSKKTGLWLLSVVLGIGLAASSAFAAKGKTFTGVVSDSMCDAKHAMAGDDAGCTRAPRSDCVAATAADQEGAPESPENAGHRITSRQ